MDSKLRQLIMKYSMLKNDCIDKENFFAAKMVGKMLEDLKVLLRIDVNASPKT